MTKECRSCKVFYNDLIISRIYNISLFLCCLMLIVYVCYEMYNYDCNLGKVESENNYLRTQINELNKKIEYKNSCIDKEKLGKELVLSELLYHKNRVVRVQASAYSENNKNNNSKTALMGEYKTGITVAVSRNLDFLLGKWVLIDGIGIRKVCDRTSSLIENRIDILVATEKEAKEFGIKEDVKVIALGEINPITGEI